MFPNSSNLILATRYLLLGTYYLILITRYKLPSICYHIFVTLFLLPDISYCSMLHTLRWSLHFIMYQVLYICYLVLLIWYLLINVCYPIVFLNIFFQIFPTYLIMVKLCYKLVIRIWILYYWRTRCKKRDRWRWIGKERQVKNDKSTVGYKHDK